MITDQVPTGPSSQAIELAALLAKQKMKIVLAESCTGGMASALLTEVPGISEHFCGSAVTYRESTKCQWLNVSQQLLNEFTAESSEVSDEMALHVLSTTCEADLSGAITGHLGPGISPEKEGQFFLSLAIKSRSDKQCIIVHRSSGKLHTSNRQQRQRESACKLLSECVNFLRHQDQSNKL